MAPIRENDDYELLSLETITQYVPLPPSCLNNPLPALCASTFSPLLLSYFPPAKGVVLGYQGVKLSDTEPSSSRRSRSERSADVNTGTNSGELLLRQVDEYSAPFVWATASLLVWHPRRHAWITGTITQQSATHISLTHLNTFPVSILRAQLPEGWTWRPSSSSSNPPSNQQAWENGAKTDLTGWWEDEDGIPVGGAEGNGELKVRIRNFDGRTDGKGRGKGFLRIEGSLLTEQEELEKQQKEKGKGKGEKKVKGALRKTQEQSTEAMEVD